MKFYSTKDRSVILRVLKGEEIPVSAAGEELAELVPGSVDAAAEKHVPVIEQNGNLVTVTVSSVDHPALPEHHIEWIILETREGGQKKMIPVGEKAQAVFALTEGDEVVAAYEYCNLHGLWKKEV